MSDLMPIKVHVEGGHQSIAIQSDGAVLIRDKVISEIVKSGVAASSAIGREAVGIKPMITISIT